MRPLRRLVEVEAKPGQRPYFTLIHRPLRQILSAGSGRGLIVNGRIARENGKGESPLKRSLSSIAFPGLARWCSDHLAGTRILNRSNAVHRIARIRSCWKTRGSSAGRTPRASNARAGLPESRILPPESQAAPDDGSRLLRRIACGRNLPQSHRLAHHRRGRPDASRNRRRPERDEGINGHETRMGDAQVMGCLNRGDTREETESPGERACSDRRCKRTADRGADDSVVARTGTSPRSDRRV